MGEAPAAAGKRGHEAQIQQDVDEVGRRRRSRRRACLFPVPGVHLLAQHGGDLEPPSGLRGGGGEQPVHARRPLLPEIPRQLHLRVGAEREPGGAASQEAPGQPVADPLDREQGVPRGTPLHLPRERRIGPQKPTYEARAMVRREGAHRDQVDDLPIGQVGQHRRLLDAIRQGLFPDGQENAERRRRSPRPVQDPADELQRLQPVVGVVEDQDHGPVEAQAHEDAAHQREPLRGALEPHGRQVGEPVVLVPGRRDQLEHRPHVDRVVGRREQGQKPLPQRRPVQPHAAEVAGEHRREPVVGAGGRPVQRLQRGRDPRFGGRLRQPLREPGGPHAGGAAKQADPRAAPLEHRLEGLPQGGPLGLPVDQGERAEAEQAGPRGLDLGRRARHRGGGSGPKELRHRSPTALLGGAPVVFDGEQAVRRRRRRAVPIRGVLAHESPQPGRQAAGHGLPGHERGRLLGQLREVHTLARERSERRRRRREGPGGAAQRVQIRPRPEVAPAAVDLLRRHVGRRAHDQLVGGLGELPVQGVSQPEVAQPQVAGAAGAQQHVARLEIAVDDAARVSVIEGAQQGEQAVPQRRPREATPVAVERAARGELHHEVGASGGQPLDAAGEPAVVVRPDDRRMVQGCHRPHLFAEGVPEDRIAGGLGRQHLDRHVPPPGGVLGPPDLAHAAPTDRFVQQQAAKGKRRVHGPP